MIGFALYLFLSFELDKTRIILICTFSLLGTIPLLLAFHYIIQSQGFEISIQMENRLIEITNNGKRAHFYITDLKSLEIHKHKGLGFYEFDFDFAKYTFKNGKYCIVNSFMADEYFIPNGIEPKIFRAFLPIIWKRTNL